MAAVAAEPGAAAASTTTAGDGAEPEPEIVQPALAQAPLEAEASEERAPGGEQNATGRLGEGEAGAATASTDPEPDPESAGDPSSDAESGESGSAPSVEAANEAPASPVADSAPRLPPDPTDLRAPGQQRDAEPPESEPEPKPTGAGGDSVLIRPDCLAHLIPGSEVRVSLDHIIDDALVVSFRLGEKIFSGVLMDLSKRFGPYGIPVTVFPKRDYRDKPEPMQLKTEPFQPEAPDTQDGPSQEPPAAPAAPHPSLWTSKPPPLFQEGAPYPPPLFIRDTYNQPIPQPPPRKIKRPKRKLYREEPTSIMNAIKLRPRQVLCDKCKGAVAGEKREARRGPGASGGGGGGAGNAAPLPPRIRLKPQRYRNEENDSSSCKPALERVQGGGCRGAPKAAQPVPRCPSTRSSSSLVPAGEAGASSESQGPARGPEPQPRTDPRPQSEPEPLPLPHPEPAEENKDTVAPEERGGDRRERRGGKAADLPAFVALTPGKPDSSDASVCSVDSADDLKSSNSECSSTETFDFPPPGAFHAPSAPSTSSASKEDKKLSNSLKATVFSKNVSKCVTPDGRTICVGDIVWAKIYGFPWWPARILAITVSRKDNGLLVRQEARISWFGSPTTSFLALSQLSPFLENFQSRFNKKRKGLYRKAITEAAKAAKQLTPEVRALLTQFET
uniref:PWWP domain containing 2A n=1 Tax=Lepisosteus oculatus TaxID=7918 RepID=W5MT29_LEPOC